MNTKRMILSCSLLVLAGCSGASERETELGSAADSLLLSTTAKSSGTHVALVTSATTRVIKFSSVGIPQLYKEEQINLTLSGTSLPTATTHTCSVEFVFKSLTGATLHNYVHTCGPAVSFEFLGSSDPAFRIDEIDIIEQTEQSGEGATVAIDFAIGMRASDVNQAGTTVATAAARVDSERIAGSIWRTEGPHYYSIDVPAGSTLSLSGDLATVSKSGTVTIKFLDAAGTTTYKCANGKYVNTMGAGGTSLSCTSPAYAAATTAYISIDNVSAWADEYANQLEYALVPTIN